MTKIVLILSLLAFSLNFGQNITFKEILSIRVMEVGKAEEFLLNKGWSFAGSETDDLGNKSVKFAYGDDLEYSESFLTLFLEAGGDNLLGIQTNDAEKYNQYIRDIEQYGAEYIGSSTEDNKIAKLYMSPLLKFLVITGLSENNLGQKKQAWYFSISPIEGQ